MNRLIGRGWTLNKEGRADERQSPLPLPLKFWHVTVVGDVWRYSSCSRRIIETNAMVKYHSRGHKLKSWEEQDILRCKSKTQTGTQVNTEALNRLDEAVHESTRETGESASTVKERAEWTEGASFCMFPASTLKQVDFWKGMEHRAAFVDRVKIGLKNADENMMACKSRKSGAIRPVPKDHHLDLRSHGWELETGLAAEGEPLPQHKPQVHGAENACDKPAPEQVRHTGSITAFTTKLVIC
ncbi:hypothetical protein C8R45DRAFT_1067248 [Mycena sanguinolenta]|nr:hypothetical protein C8R45DRAFT_1067248 [Mycena sanguinolenta]